MSNREVQRCLDMLERRLATVETPLSHPASHLPSHPPSHMVSRAGPHAAEMQTPTGERATHSAGAGTSGRLHSDRKASTSRPERARSAAAFECRVAAAAAAENSRAAAAFEERLASAAASATAAAVHEYSARPVALEVAQRALMQRQPTSVPTPTSIPTPLGQSGSDDLLWDRAGALVATPHQSPKVLTRNEIKSQTLERLSYQSVAAEPALSGARLSSTTLLSSSMPAGAGAALMKRPSTAGGRGTLTMGRGSGGRGSGGRGGGRGAAAGAARVGSNTFFR